MFILRFLSDCNKCCLMFVILFNALQKIFKNSFIDFDTFQYELINCFGHFEKYLEFQTMISAALSISWPNCSEFSISFWRRIKDLLIYQNKSQKSEQQNRIKDSDNIYFDLCFLIQYPHNSKTFWNQTCLLDMSIRHVQCLIDVPISHFRLVFMC